MIQFVTFGSQIKATCYLRYPAPNFQLPNIISRRRHKNSACDHRLSVVTVISIVLFLQRTATPCSTVLHTATHCVVLYSILCMVYNTLQHSAVHCNSLLQQDPVVVVVRVLSLDLNKTNNTSVIIATIAMRIIIYCVAACCSVLQRVAV